MAKDVLTEARKLMRLRFFEKAIITLEARSSYYEDNFDYYLLLAIAYLYTGDTGSATVYFQKARQIRLTDTDLLLGIQAFSYVAFLCNDEHVTKFVNSIF